MSKMLRIIKLKLLMTDYRSCSQTSRRKDGRLVYKVQNYGLILILRYGRAEDE